MLFYLSAGLLGVISQVLIAYQSLSKDARKANTQLPFVQFLKNDWVGMALAVIPVLVWMLTFGELAEHYPLLEEYTRISFFLVGLAGSYGLQKVFSRSKEWIRDVIDRKTDIADNKTQA
jgi:uncharacterized membrane protein YuzA (DUF378 family)